MKTGRLLPQLDVGRMLEYHSMTLEAQTVAASEAEAVAAASEAETVAAASEAETAASEAGTAAAASEGRTVAWPATACRLLSCLH